jgi:hypothetical protein
MMHPRPVHEYHVVVARRASLWGWEIYRDGVPLPVPLRGGYYKSKRATEAAGALALRGFLDALDREQDA